jgi:hypothetical protein
VPTSTLPPARSVADVLLVDVARQVNRGCGDLIFSSHVTFTLTMVLTYQRYGGCRRRQAGGLGGRGAQRAAHRGQPQALHRGHRRRGVHGAAVRAAFEARLRDPPQPGAVQQAALLLPR